MAVPGSPALLPTPLLPQLQEAASVSRGSDAGWQSMRGYLGREMLAETQQLRSLVEDGYLLISDLPPSLSQGRATNLQRGVLITRSLSESIRPCKSRNT